MNKSENFFKDGENCIVIDKDNYIDQIDKILNNYQNYSHIKKNAHEFAKSYSWNVFVEKIHIEICRKFFSPQIYKELYDIELPLDNEILWNHWLDYGLKKNHICLNINIPSGFNFKDYNEYNNLNFKSKYKIFVHWYLHGKNPDYINSKSDIGMSFNPENLNCTMQDFFKITEILNRVSNYKIRDEALDDLFTIASNNPRLKINEILAYYLNLIE